MYKPGDKILLVGYNQVAHAQVTEGGGPPSRHEIIVLNNNSTHYLLLWRGDGEDEEFGYFITSFAYHDIEKENADEISHADAYSSALDRMISLAKSN